MKAPPCFDDPETRRLIRKVCEEHDIDDELLKDLCENIMKYSGSGKAFGQPEDIDLSLERFLTREKEA